VLVPFKCLFHLSAVDSTPWPLHGPSMAPYIPYALMITASTVQSDFSLKRVWYEHHDQEVGKGFCVEIAVNTGSNRAIASAWC